MILGFLIRLALILLSLAACFAILNYVLKGSQASRAGKGSGPPATSIPADVTASLLPPSHGSEEDGDVVDDGDGVDDGDVVDAEKDKDAQNGEEPLQKSDEPNTSPPVPQKDDATASPVSTTQTAGVEVPAAVN